MQTPQQPKVLAKPGNGAPKETPSAGKSGSSDPKVESEGSLSASPKNEEQAEKADKKPEEPSSKGETDVQTVEQDKTPVNPSGDSSPETKSGSSDPKVESEGSLSASPKNEEQAEKADKKPEEPSSKGETDVQTVEQDKTPVNPSGDSSPETKVPTEESGSSDPKVESELSLPASTQNEEQGENEGQESKETTVNGEASKQTPEQNNKLRGSPSEGPPKENASAGKSDKSDAPNKPEVAENQKPQGKWKLPWKKKLPRKPKAPETQEAPGHSGSQQPQVPPQQGEVTEPGKKETAMPSLQQEANEDEHCGGAYPRWKARVLEKYQSELPYGCTMDDLSQNLMNQATLGLRNKYCSRLNKKDAYVTFFYHVIYLEREYYAMVDYMQKLFYGIAKGKNLSEENKLKLWEECKRELLCELECFQKAYESLFLKVLDSKNGNDVKGKPLDKLAGGFDKTIQACISRKKEKGESILTEKVKNYRAGASGQRSTQGNEKPEKEKEGEKDNKEKKEKEGEKENKEKKEKEGEKENKEKKDKEGEKENKEKKENKKK
ncbi:hypothetical protein AK88_04572 [Plasmodium fragile]|uniref:Plasmodium RESA N-terminal domain-containing protein n=1 Tax=Plasmodium fragile TaxID=5857 RepID=A0A0D9QFQ3_PLAFR|nr:uncharacterized protein AK88_04572 [Plasmodium fragile]KJP85813.1 hypothetical protein AK88_04572 [Plasmodium fragile]